METIAEGKKSFEAFGTLELIKIAAKCGPWRAKLDELFKLARKNFIFDNLAIYGQTSESTPIDVIYARAIGRGKSAEADVTWGDAIVNRVLNAQSILIENPQDLTKPDRLQLPYILGMPLCITEKSTAALICIRFGGPIYTEDDQNFAIFLAGMVTSILRQKYLAEYAEMLEDEKNTSKLQFDFINTISHELRSPLGFIRGYATTLLRDDAQWDRTTQVDFLQIIEREANSLTELIDNLLDSSRLQSGVMKFNLQVMRIDSLIRDEINRSLLVNPNQSIELVCDNKVPPLIGDARRLAQVFDNLLSNARKYAPDSPIKITIQPEGAYLLITFADTGPGIPKSYQSKIFTRFFRVPENSLQEHGSGLGLSICKQIIELHNGTISIDPDAQGTVFTIALPYNTEG
jgi:signal transduction histidine kinase